MILPTSSLLLVLAAVANINAHGKVASIKGANGAVENGLAVVPSTPNTGTTKAIDADTPILGQKTSQNVTTSTGCGKTKGGGTIDCDTAAAESLATAGGTVPTANADGTVHLSFHQVNGDGAGPMTAAVSTDMGKTWTEATVLTDVAGKNGNSQVKDQEFPVKVQVPAGTQCAGTSGSTTGVCLVALANPVAGFGGSAPFDMGGSAAASALAPATSAAAKRALSADEIGVDPSDYSHRSLLKRSPALEPEGSWQFKTFVSKRELSADEIAVLQSEGVDPSDYSRRALHKRHPALEPEGSFQFHAFRA